MATKNDKCGKPLTCETCHEDYTLFPAKHLPCAPKDVSRFCCQTCEDAAGAR